MLSAGGYLNDDVTVVADLDSALSVAAAQCEIDSTEECFVVGGAQVYGETLDRADRLYCTLVDAEVDGDTFFCFVRRFAEFFRAIRTRGVSALKKLCRISPVVTNALKYI